MRKSDIPILLMLVGIITSAGIIGKKTYRILRKTQERADRYYVLFNMMKQWLHIKQEGKSLNAYFEQRGYKSVAIYGMGHAGDALLAELKNSNVNVEYGIDQKADFLYADVDIFSMDDSLGAVDVIVVTAVTFFDEIKKELEKKVNYPIISLQDILYEI